MTGDVGRSRANSEGSTPPATSLVPAEEPANPPVPAARRSSTSNAAMLVILVAAGTQVIPRDSYLQIPYICILGLLLGLMVRSYIKGDPKSPEQEFQQRHEVRTREIRALENELGIEPMELWSDEDPEIVSTHIEKKEKP